MNLVHQDEDVSDEHTPSSGSIKTIVKGGDLAARFEAERIVVKVWVEDAITEAIGPVEKKMDAVIAAHNASPVKRTFDIIEKAINPVSGTLLVAIPLVLVLWATGLPFEGPGYKIGTAAAARANEDSDDDAGVSGGVSAEPTE